VTITNWAGNVVFTPAALTRPGSADELRAIVARARKARVLGAGHSFSAIADSPDALLSLDDLPREIDIDSHDSTVRVGAAVRYGELAARVDANGFALANMASLPHITVAGATATGTHGSGDRNRALATAITAIDLVTADGDLVTIPEADLRAAAVSLGALGVITALTLKLVPAFTVRQRVYDNLDRTELEANFAEIYSSAYSLSAFTTWRDPQTIDMLWVKDRADQPRKPDNWHGATRADGPRHPIPGMPTESTTVQDDAEGRWHERLPHFRAEFKPSVGDELQSEYLLPREHAADAVKALSELAPRIAPLLLINEIRTVAADDLWLSPCYGRDTVALHFTWRKDPEAVIKLLPALEDSLAPYTPRPHWGKVFTLPPENVRAAYPHLPDFARLARDYDPAGKFRNGFLSEIVGIRES
jgi:xylitol oxidase